MAWWSRKRIARELEVSPQRVHQLEAAGQLAPPMHDENGDLVWPDTYARAFVGRRQGRRVSGSVFGTSPATSASVLSADAILQLQTDFRFPMLAFRIDHPEVPVVFLQALAYESNQVLLTAPGRCSVRALEPYREEVRLGAMRAAELWFDGDFTRAAFVLVTEQYGAVRFHEIVLIDDPEEPPQRNPHWLAMSEMERMPRRSEHSPITAAVLAHRLGRPVPVFAPQHLTMDTIGRWQAAGRQPVTVVVDDAEYEQDVVAASIVDSVSALSRPDRTSIVDAMLARIRWEENGAAPDLPPYLAAGLADRDDDPTSAEPQLRLQYPDFASRLPEHLRDRPRPVPVDGPTFERIANTVQDLIFNTFGEYGDRPSARTAHALQRGIGSLYAIARSHALSTDDDTFWSVASGGVEPVTFREWSSHPWHSAMRDYEATFVSPVPADDAAFRGIGMLLRKHASYHVDRNVVDSLRVEYFRDAAGVPVGRIRYRTRDGETVHYVAAVPVIRATDTMSANVRNFHDITVEPNTQEGPVLLSTPAGPTVMPFATPHPGGFTHGYGGSGPSDLAAAIIGFIGCIVDAPVSDATRDLVWAAVVSADQDGSLVLPRSLLVGSTSTS